ncbi:MAG: DoxX family protein [Cyanobacteria bacterium P01_A01_bin.116]
MTYVPLAARICLALIFLNAGVKHLTGFPSFVETIASKGLPGASVLAVATVAFLLLGSLSLLLGYKTKIGALLLILFLVPTSLLFHPPATDLTGFLKNLALIGGLLMTIANGPGLISVDGGKA